MNQMINDEAISEINISIACITDVGRVRKSNQDTFIVADLTGRRLVDSSGELPISSVGKRGWLLAVADGMGGAQAGDVASRMATEQLARGLVAVSEDEPIAACLHKAIKAANREIRRIGESRMEYKGMGATLTAAIIRDGRAIIGQVGDSRGYLIREGHIHQVTKDQSLVQSLIDAGQVTEEQAAHFPYRNVILHALGVEDEVEPDIGAVTLKDGDYLLLCSDGLSNKVGNVEMHDIVFESENLKKACERLVNLANERGGEDNITLVLARFDGAKLSKPNPDTANLLQIEHL